KKDFWALHDINVKIDQGERIGIIGKNGAGKSTLLKILSRVTWPTSGNAIIRGRLSSLLEVGTGFHPELTGRENIYLNGSILGLKKREIDRKFDAIVDFSGVENFLDTALKNYSTGMQLRLAFAVAAHLEPEILLIDEVLAVGDMEFQKKCLGKMEEVSKQHGRTIVFVSHSMAALKQLCTKGLLLENGRLIYQGSIQTTVDKYSGLFQTHSDGINNAQFDLTKHADKANNNGLLSAAMYVNGQLNETFIPGSEMKILLTYRINDALIDPEIGIVIKDENNMAYLGWNNKHIGQKLYLKTREIGQATIIIPALNIFSPGKYYVDLFFGDPHQFYECLYNSFEFTIIQDDVDKSGILLNPALNKIYIDNVTIKT